MRKAKLVKVLKEETRIINADYSAMEVRIAAAKSGSSKMCDFFNKGHSEFGSDFHSYSATLLYRNVFDDPNFKCPPKELNGEPNPEFLKKHVSYRNNAKILSFKIIYGGMASTLMDDFGIDNEEDMQVIIDNYFVTYPKLKDMLDNASKAAENLGYIKINNVFDRRFFLPDAQFVKRTERQMKTAYGREYQRMNKEQRATYKENLYNKNPQLKEDIRKAFSIKNATVRLSYNYPIQGSGGDIMKTALVILNNRIVKEGLYTTMLIHNVHDEILGQSPLSESEYAGECIVDSMEKGGAYIFNEIKMTASAETGMYWAH